MAGFSTGRVRALLERHVEEGLVPGAVAVVARHGEVHVEATGTLAFAGPGSGTPMAADTIVRLGSMTKPFVAACAMTLVDDGTLRLDDPLMDLLPELADLRVLADPAGPLDDTVPLRRPVTLRDLLTYTVGTGFVDPGTPIADAIGGLFRAVPPDEWIARFGATPLVHQPGERWMYEISANVTVVLVARAAGKTFGEALRERVCDPLGLTDTGFSVPEADRHRFATAYARDDDEDGRPVVADAPDGLFSAPPVFESGGGGLVSTAADFLAFATALRAGGAPVLSRPAVTLMTTDHLTPEQKAVSGFRPGYFDDIGWGFGMSVRTRQQGVGPSVGSYGWSGFWGTAWYDDPAADRTSIVLLQRAHMGDQTLPLWDDLWSAIYG